jgi:hypothetical protein
MFGPSLFGRLLIGTMASADSCRFSRTSRYGLPIESARRQASQGKSVVFPSIYLLHLLSIAFGSKDFVLLGRLIQRSLASYEVRVPQAGGLPLASFRFRLAADTLALSYGYCYLRHSGLSPYRQRPCRAHPHKKPILT